MAIGAKSLILDLLATLKPGAVMPVGVLVEAGALFGISDNNVRVSAARLLADGQIARDERGAYRLGEKSQPIGKRVRSWRDLDRRTRPWDGGWIGVFSSTGMLSRKGAQQRRRALELLGFGELRRGLWLRPDNLSASLEQVRIELRALGVPVDDLVCVLRDLDERAGAAARGLWDVKGLRRQYRQLCSEIERGADRMASMPSDEAMVESFVLGGRALRQLVRDPLLPDELCPSEDRNALLTAMREYDYLGRLAWAEMLKRWGVPYLRAPLQGRSEAERVQSALFSEA